MLYSFLTIYNNYSVCNKKKRFELAINTKWQVNAKKKLKNTFVLLSNLFEETINFKG